MKLFSWRKIAFMSASGVMALITAANTWATESLEDVIKRRGLTEKDVLAAAETYVPTGGRDEYIVFSSGGQSGHIIVYGIPSMRLLKYIGVFTPEPWQGYGFDEQSKAVLAQGRIQGKDITYGDTHHPALSETNGEYDGKYLFINDKANPRIAVIDLRDFETKQIVVNPVFKSSHGGAFVTENTEYVIEAAQYPAPFENEYVPLEQFNERYRGGMTYWRFDRKKGRIIPDQSFTVMAPPYSQDLSDFGKGPSSGWSFTNSFCSERYVGGIMQGKPPFEAGCSAKDTDFMHVVDWRKAAELVKAGKATKINGHDVITIDTAVKEGILYLIPEPKSPHGVDVTPNGKYIIVNGKLDTHMSVYDFAKIQKAIADKNFEGTDPYGIPIIPIKAALHIQVQVGLGPLHTQFDSKDCIAYTSLYVDSMIAKWDFCRGKVLDKIAIHYNVGHLMTTHGDTVKPEGKYLVALNKLAIDRFNPVGPLHPQNHQLIDISGDKMRLLYDMPLPLGEPHYAVAINAKVLKPIKRVVVETTYTKADYDKLVKENVATQAVIDQVVAFITKRCNNFKDFPPVVDLVVDATDQLNFALKTKAKAEAAAAKEDWQNATLWANQWWQYQVKAADIGLRAKTYLEQHGAVCPPKPEPKQMAEQETEAQVTEADYNQLAEKNQTQLATLHKGMGAILSRNYYEFPEVAALVEDALNELNTAKDAENNTKAAADKGDWQTAVSEAKKWQQSQDKAAKIGSQAKTALEQQPKAKEVVGLVMPTPPAVGKPVTTPPMVEPIVTTGLDGAALYQSKGCVACHGADGKTPLMSSYPNIAGQGHGYTFAQMKDVKSGVRKNGQMVAMTGTLDLVSDTEMAAIAQWLASLPGGEGTPGNATLAAKGEALYKSSKTNCLGCHGADAKTPLRPDHFPKLAAQNKEYIIAQMKDIKSGARDNGNSAAMKGIMQGVTNEEMAAIAEWVASLKGPDASEIVTVLFPDKPVKVKPIVVSPRTTTDGAALYQSKGCVACHGTDGKTPLMSSYPNLAGQGHAYIFAQMKDIKSGGRDNGQTAAMKGVVASVSDTEMAAIAQWLASLPGGEGTAGDATLIAKGEALYKSSKTNCLGCHGADAKTPLRPDMFPKIAAQNKEYIIAQMKDIKSGARDNGNSAAMKGIMHGVTDEEMAAIAEWVASLKGPEAKVIVVQPPKVDGAKLYTSKGCIACHGADGKMPIMPNYPKLAGQNQDYALAQMADIKSGARHNGLSVAMKSVIQIVSDDEMTAIAQWLAGLPLEEGTAGDATLAAKGAELYKSKTCVACHGKDANTPLQPTYPKLAGLNPAYTLAQMKDIKSGARNNGQTAGMKGVMPLVNDEEMAAIAEWLVFSIKAPKVEPPKVETPTVEAPTVEPPTVEAPKVEPPPVEPLGAKLYTSKGCIACHGADGKMPIMPNYPKLAGQNQDYALAQMADIKSGARHNGLSVAMKSVIQIVSDDEMTAIAQWLAGLPLEEGTAGDATLAAKGAELYKSKTCVACHGKDANTPLQPTYPKLAGLNPAYTLAQMKDIKSGARNNGQTVVMKAVMPLVNDEEMAAIAQWLVSPVEKQPVVSENGNGDVQTCDADNLVKPEDWKMAPETRLALELEPDLENGLDVYEVCAACHLDEGWGREDGTFPQLAGQHRTVLIKQLADIRALNRDNPTMYPFALPRAIGGPQSLSDVTGYIAEKLFMNPNNGKGPGDDLEHGEQLYKENCVKCHCEQGQGSAKNFYPRIQGQHYKYMLRQFEWIRDGKRRNANPDMVKQIQGFTDRDMKAVIDHASRIKPPKELVAPPGWKPDLAD